MKRVIAVFGVVIALGLAPLVVSAQSFPAFPSFGGPGNCSGSPSYLCAPKFTVGYTANRDAVSFGLSAKGPGSVGLFGVSPYLGNARVYPVRGVWFGGSLPVSLNGPLSANAYAGFLVPANSGLAETQDWSLLNILPIQVTQGWRTDVEWWNVGGEFLYNVSGSTVLVVGFRFDSFRTTFKDNAPPTIIFTGIPGAESDLDVYSYLPYFGVMAVQDWGGGQLSGRVIGFPFLPGEAKFATTRNTTLGPFGIYDRFEASGPFDSGYFVEFSVEYARRFGRLMASLFGKYELIHGRATVELDRNQASFLGVGGTDLDYALSFQRSLWTVGGSLELPFSSPF